MAGQAVAGVEAVNGQPALAQLVQRGLDALGRVSSAASSMTSRRPLNATSTLR